MSTMLRKISEGNKIIIPRCTGKRTIANSKHIFGGLIEKEIKRLNVPKTKTPQIETDVFELIQTSPTYDIFSSLGNLDDLVFTTEDQVVTFCEINPNWLSLTGTEFGFVMCGGLFDDKTLFLVKQKGEFSIITVSHYRDFWDDIRLGATLRNLNWPGVYVGSSDKPKTRIIIPKK